MPNQDPIIGSPPTTPVSPTATVTIPPAPAGPITDANIVHHLSRWQSVLSVLEGMLMIGTSPEVVALLPTKYQAYVAAVSAIETAATSTAK